MSDRASQAQRTGIRGLPILACLWLPACTQQGSPADPGPVARHWETIETYCFDCHNTIDRAGDLAFEDMSPDRVGAQAAVWEKALRKLRGGLMPPPGNPRPGEDRVELLVASLEKRLAEEAAAAGSRPGYVGLHRLNRTEYANAVRDLLGVEVDAAALLPRDNAKDGYDNIASVLTVSPTYLEQYVAAARTVATQAVGDPSAAPGSVTYINEDAGSKRHVEGLPLGTRGGLAVVHNFPADGAYRINVAEMAAALWVFDMEFENTVLVMIDGREVYRTTIGGEADQKAIDQNGVSAVDKINARLKNIEFETTAGPHEVAVTFLARSFAESDGRLQLAALGGGQNRLLEISSFEIQGPFEPTGVSDTPARRRIFTCRPGEDGSAEAAEPCARRILGRLARRAYRRPVADAELHDLMAFYRAGREAGGFEAGIRKAATAILASPEFLYRFATPEDVSPGARHALGDFELASRLSFFLWSSIPDEELLAAAEQGSLRGREELEAQVRRMLADERASALVTDFAFQWLDVASLDDVEPDRAVFPYAAGSTDPRAAYERELELFMRSILLEDRSVLELLTADHTYLNETVALLYGIDGVRGDQFRRVELDDPARRGLLGKGALLMATSYPNRTAPVLRGKFILDNLIGSPPSPPPADVDTDLAEPEGDEPKTVPERLAAHRTNPSCNACHGVMDPLGLALENFNAIGEWRERDRLTGTPIDASGELAGGGKLDGPNDVRAALASEPERFVRTLTEELMTYALGRSLEYYDMPVVRRIVEQAARDDYRFSSLVAGIVESDAFRMLEVPGAAEAVTADTGERPQAEAP